ncbi:tRNA (cytosine-5-)-methyltransferase ncl1 [Pseudogymnoascus australis]
MPSLKQSRSKRTTPIAIVSNKGPWSQWHDLNDTEINSPPPTVSAAMRSADPISAPEAGKTKQTPRSLTFFDLPSETQNAIIKQCPTPDLISLSLVSKHFRDLAAARIYRYFHIVFPDGDDGSYESDMDGLAAGLDTIVTSEYDYARYLKEIDLESLSGGAKGERAYGQYTYDLSCGKFMNTLLLLTLRKAKTLETFRWDVRVELSRPVYKSLHGISALKHLCVRMHSGSSLYQKPPPLPSLKCFPDDTIEMVKKFTKAIVGRSEDLPMKMSNAEARAILASHAKDLKTDHGPPTISGFKNLKTLAILDMDSLEYVKEIRTCIHNSSSTLKKLKLSFSEELARKARKPPPVDDTGDDSDQEMDEFGNMIPPPPVGAPSSTDDSSSPGKAFRALEAKQAQDAVLAQIFGLDSKAREVPASDAGGKEKKASGGMGDTVNSFIKDITALSKKVMGAPSSSELTPEQREFMKAIEKRARKLLKGEMGALAGDSGKDGLEEDSNAESSTEKATPSSTSDTSDAGKAEEEDKAKTTESEDKYVGLFDNEDKKAPKANQSTIDSPQPDDIDVCEPEMGLDPQDDDSAASELAPETANDGIPITAVGSTESSSPKKLEPTLITAVESMKSLTKDFIEKPDLGKNFSRDVLELALAKRALEGYRFHDIAVDSYQYNVIKEAAEAHNKSLEKTDKSMSEYVRTTRGLTLKSLSIYLIPIKTSVLSRAVDLHVLERLSLLNVGSQAPLWNYLAKENKISPLPLCKIHTDNVTAHFLKFVNQLENLEELFILERSTKSSEYSFAPKTTVTNDNIRRYVLKKHASSLVRLVVKNENDYTWDANVKFLELLCQQGKNLTELGISFASPALHTLNQFLPGLVSLKALHIINFRNEDTCHWVMREIPRFIADALSSHPSMKLEYLALGSTVGRLAWKVKVVPKPEDKGKGKATIYTSNTNLIPEEKLSESESEEDDSAPGLRLETVECGRFYDVPGGGRGGGRGKGRGGGGGGRDSRDNRVSYDKIEKTNEKFERYYDSIIELPEEERVEFWAALRRDLPNSFRFAGSKGHALAVQKQLRERYIPEITKIEHYDGTAVEAPKPVPWYPDELAWWMTTPKNVVRRFPPFAAFQKYLVSETSVGNISRQEVVSMIPPLLMGIEPGMTVLDMCAAPGSKAAQLLEMVHKGEEARIRNALRLHAKEDGREVSPGLEVVGDEDLNVDSEDFGRATGLLIANDSDYKRSHMLIHQLKRLSSPNLIVTNHDATIFPSIKLPSTKEDPAQNRYLKFDRILADVPCSGDGTCRKNPNLWQDWSPSNALGLYVTQVRILVRALQMLKAGGRVVYSTCSMNPVENEAVIASAIERCGGLEKVQLVDCSDQLVGLKRKEGLKKWTIMDKSGKVWEDWPSVDAENQKGGANHATARLAEGMFTPTGEAAKIPLERCMRVYAHQQDTGGFFITVLQKMTEFKAKPESEAKKSEPKPAVISIVEEIEAQPEPAPGANVAPKIEAADLLEGSTSTDLQDQNVPAVARENQASDKPDATLPAKRAFDDSDVAPSSPKKAKIESNGTEAEAMSLDNRQVHFPPPPGAELDATIRPGDLRPETTPAATTSLPAPVKAKGRNQQQFEEPFKYISGDHPEVQSIDEFYKLSQRFPRDRFMVRNALGEPAKTIYYTSALIRDILVENEGKGIKFIHGGVRMFMKQDVQGEGVCRWRIQSEGMPILEGYVGEGRVVRLYKRSTLRKLLIEMFPKVTDGCWKELGEIGERVRDIGMGCCVLRIEPSDDEDGFKERIVLPLWRSLHSLNLMLAKEDRTAMLLRIFNENVPLVNNHHPSQRAAAVVDAAVAEAEVAEAETANGNGGAVAEKSEDVEMDAAEAPLESEAASDQL